MRKVITVIRERRKLAESIREWWYFTYGIPRLTLKPLSKLFLPFFAPPPTSFATRAAIPKVTNVRSTAFGFQLLELLNLCPSHTFFFLSWKHHRSISNQIRRWLMDDQNDLPSPPFYFFYFSYLKNKSKIRLSRRMRRA